ncbi:hypothetical protein BGZ58_003674 [Dissophora ornata]|nr:hypothetical protein BGZ58_003674 [Dissophora ornata]
MDHEGVMIQCETCKVWQHCPCVGLGDGEVTPDKYYCDSCRPENHPYRVVDGQLISSSKRVHPALAATASKAKSSKKRSTMNSKDASLPSDIPSAHHSKDDEDRDAADSFKRNHNPSTEDHLYSSNQNFSHTRTSKRRKKTESNMDDHEDLNNDTTYSLSGKRSGEESSDNFVPAEKESESPSSSVEASPKTVTKGKVSRTSKSKKPAVKPFSTQSPPESPRAKDQDSSLANDDQEEELSHEPLMKQQASRRPGGKKLSRSGDITEQALAISIKRRKVAKSEASPHEASSSAVDHDDESNQVSPNESSMDSPDVPASSASASNSNSNNGIDSLSTPTATTKRNSRRAATHRAGSHTPTPSGTPQPMQPASPTKIKYPSARMSLKDMNKRAQQLLDYIGRAQVEMGELKRKQGQRYQCSSSSPTTEATPPRAGSEGGQPAINLDIMQGINKAGSTDAASAHWLSTPPQSVHELSHGDLAEQLATTQMKQVMDGAGHSRPVDHPGSAGSGHACGKGVAPMTPPHQPNGYGGAETGQIEEVPQKNDHLPGLGIAMPRVTSLGLMNKLTVELIHFQEKYGRHTE